MFSSEEGQWKSYVVTSPVVLLCRKPLNYMVPFKGMLHWLNYPYVVVFDPCNVPEEISRVILMKIDTRARTLPFIDSFGVYYGRLRASHSTNPIYQCVRELQDYDAEKWSLVHKFDAPEKNWVHYVHLDGNIVYGKMKSSIWISNLLTGGMDQKYELVRGVRQRGELSHVSAHLIGNEWWPTTVPSIRSSPE
ncbi:unnamed protein product [Cuscuta campestris]|uniref:Uncharacterized protein n=1 Tax=Cuscuta campestris TaxID=132261 RepID=A0A484L2F7_9ASTE|nr:unnamed protein product [Cuscuta campestris]